MAPNTAIARLNQAPGPVETESVPAVLPAGELLGQLDGDLRYALGIMGHASPDVAALAVATVGLGVRTQLRALGAIEVAPCTVGEADDLIGNVTFTARGLELLAAASSELPESAHGDDAGSVVDQARAALDRGLSSSLRLRDA